MKKIDQVAFIVQARLGSQRVPQKMIRPFAGTILLEHAHEWFDMKGLEQSPHMMFAMDCKEGVAEKIPSIIHVDGTCRIQTVTKKQNIHYYEIIEEFYK